MLINNCSCYLLRLADTMILISDYVQYHITYNNASRFNVSYISCFTCCVFRVKIPRYPRKNMNIYCYHNKAMLFTIQFVQHKTRMYLRI